MKDKMESKRPKLESELVSDKKEISDEVAQRIEKNRYEAKMKLSAKSTFGLINNFGISWYKILEPEFSKQYFLQVKLRI